MKKMYIVGNWKSNKTAQEANEWISTFQNRQETFYQILLGVPFQLLPLLHGKLPIAAQNVSPFVEGAYTGEIAASQIKEFADWVIIGHSERRNYFKEDDLMLSQKVMRAKEAHLSVIYCISDAQMPIPKGVDIVAYEPLWAIGTGKSDTPQNANAVCQQIKNHFFGDILYGGSVTEENVRSFIDQDAIDGVLVGGASLDSKKFTNLIKNATS